MPFFKCGLEGHPGWGSQVEQGRSALWWLVPADQLGKNLLTDL